MPDPGLAIAFRPLDACSLPCIKPGSHRVRICADLVTSRPPGSPAEAPLPLPSELRQLARPRLATEPVTTTSGGAGAGSGAVAGAGVGQAAAREGGRGGLRAGLRLTCKVAPAPAMELRICAAAAEEMFMSGWRAAAVLTRSWWQGPSWMDGAEMLFVLLRREYLMVCFLCV